MIIREFQERCRRGLLSTPSPTPHPHVPNSEDAVVVPSKARLKRLISENSAYEKRPDFRMCWYVHPQVLRSFGQECLPVPCQWTYVTAMPSTPREDTGNTSEGPDQGTPMPIKRKPTATMCITQFMKKRRYDGQVSCRGHGPCSPVPIADCALATQLVPGQRIALQHWFPPAISWGFGVDLRLPGLCSNRLYPLGHLTSLLQQLRSQ